MRSVFNKNKVEVKLKLKTLIAGLFREESLGTPNILGTGATFHLGPLCLHVENLECRAQKW